jgi:hypothetical protein
MDIPHTITTTGSGESAWFVDLLAADQTVEDN